MTNRRMSRTAGQYVLGEPRRPISIQADGTISLSLVMCAARFWGRGAVIPPGGSLLRVADFEASLTLDGVSVIKASLRCHPGKEAQRGLFIEMLIRQFKRLLSSHCARSPAGNWGAGCARGPPPKGRGLSETAAAIAGLCVIAGTTGTMSAQCAGSRLGLEKRCLRHA